jgi:hypothetical protein
MVAVADAIGWASRQIMDRVPKADLDQRDPDFIRDQLPGTWLLASLYFRAGSGCATPGRVEQS